MTASQEMSPATHGDVALVELVNRVVDRGVVIGGDVVISVAGVDLILLELRMTLRSVEDTAARLGLEAEV